MSFIYAEYNMLHNCIDVTTFDGQILRIDCGKAEKGLKTTPCSECALNTLAMGTPLNMQSIGIPMDLLYFEGSMQIWIDAENSLELW